jgi:hypothetical protein
LTATPKNLAGLRTGAQQQDLVEAAAGVRVGVSVFE